MKLATVLAALPVVVVAASLLPADARACGGCFHGERASPTQSPSVVTDHRMVLAITPTMTTLWDQVEYAGDPSEFAWVLPIRGRVVVGLGTDGFINALDVGTAPVVRAPPSSCAPVAFSSGGGGCGSSSEVDYAAGGESPNLGWQEDSGVYVTDRSVVGPYETVQVHGTDAGGIVGWLRGNKYEVPKDLEPMLAKYVGEGFDFVAVKLRPGYGVQAMRPIRVSFKGAYPSLPLRMVRAGVGERVGLKLFVVADGRWKTSNFPALSIDPSMLTWDFRANRTDYSAVRAREAAKFDDRAFVLESSVDLGRSAVPNEPSPAYPAPAPALDTGVADAGAGADAAFEGATPDDASADALVFDGAPGVGPDAAPDVEPDAARPGYDAGEKPGVDPYASDVEVAFGTKPVLRVTRLRADLPSKYLDVDLVLEADGTQAELSPTLQVTRRINESCPQSSGGSDSSCVIPDRARTTSLRLPAAVCLAALGAALVRRRRR